MLIVEDGTGKADAESYISVADATAYHAARGNAAWAAIASDTLRENYLRRATDYMEQVYRAAWKGTRMTATMALSWPRAYVYLEAFLHGAVGEYPYLVPNNIVPTEVGRACAELALRAAAGTLLADQTQGVLMEKIGPIETQYDKYSPQSVRYAAVNGLLHSYLKSNGGGVNVELGRA